MRRHASLVLIGVVLAMAAAGCTRSRDLTGTQLRVWLTTPLQRNVVKDQEFRVNVDAADTAGKPLRDLKVTAEVLDSVNTSIGKYNCRPVGDKPGRYQSDSFVSPPQAQAGAWTVKATAGQGESIVSSVVAVQVGESLGAQAQAQHGFALKIPPSWDITDQQSTAQGGILRLDPLPGDSEKAVLEIRYVHGNVDAGEEPVRKALLAVRPIGFEQGNSSIRQITPVKVQDHPGLLARGTFVTDLGKDKLDRSFSVELVRFYCTNTDRTFTVIQASTSDVAMSAMSALLDEFRCH